MYKIDKITEEQKSRFPEWVEKWMKIGLSTERADFDAAELSIGKIYDSIGLKRPMVYLRLGSPMGATLGGAYAVLLLNELAKQNNSVRNSVENSVWKSVWNSVENSVWKSVRNSVGNSVWKSVENSVGNSVRNSVWNSVRDSVDGAAKEGFYNFRGGQFWASWFAYITFFRDVMGWRGDGLPEFELDEVLGKSIGWAWWHENVVAMSDRPTKINLDKEGRLHSENDFSIVYPDGWGLHSWHGVTVQPYVITNPEQITVQDIEKEENVEVRRVKIERYGQAKYLTDSGAKEIHRDEFGVLYQKEIRNDEPLVMVKVKNSTPEQDGSFKDYFIRVAPTVKTAKEAVAWTFDESVETYSPLQET